MAARKPSRSPSSRPTPHASAEPGQPRADVTPYQDIFARFGVGPEHQQPFAAFIETGRAPAAFAKHLEKDPRWQMALELAFERRLGRVGDGLRSLASKRTRKKVAD